ncbi:alpha/beta hydrolase [Aspergillus mulundensis]|uniref:Alpha/beta hydrolase fold-3 domain-containing protein n=1 Tax=Aspergillus mulundensis TaxID=1810919 RepID=A0A3D8R4Q4_9EURO|nr:hypothetical protein DSM5745_08708 [Aspergillus mulundensis]RDW68948.1 hypothetical protein DSM5745_08708 [Aspergillus mulundensis]
MGLILEPNPALPITFIDLIQTGFTLCFRVPWVAGSTLIRRWWPWNRYKPPPLREHLFRHVMTCLGNHIPLSVIQWYSASDTSGTNLKQSVRYGHIQHLFEPVRKPKFNGNWICRGLFKKAIEPRNVDIVLFHVHGGGYAVGHPCVSAPEHVLLAEILERHKITTAIFSLDYTLTPRGAFPKQRDEAMAAYDWLCGDMGVDPSRIVVLGESAGAHLILSLLVGIYEKRSQNPILEADSKDLRPAAAVLVSPWINLHTSHPRVLELHWEERLFKRSLDTYCKWILRDATPKNDLLYGNFAIGREARGSWADILPPRSWITAGADELVFRFDIEDFVEQAKADGADVVFEVTPGKSHAWQCAEAFGQQDRLLDLPLSEELPDDLMEGYRELAENLLKVISSMLSV